MLASVKLQQEEVRKSSQISKHAFLRPDSWRINIPQLDEISLLLRMITGAGSDPTFPFNQWAV